jgi:hypothetical protein
MEQSPPWEAISRSASKKKYQNPKRWDVLIFPTRRNNKNALQCIRTAMETSNNIFHNLLIYNVDYYKPYKKLKTWISDVIKTALN